MDSLYWMKKNVFKSNKSTHFSHRSPSQSQMNGKKGDVLLPLIVIFLCALCSFFCAFMGYKLKS